MKYGQGRSKARVSNHARHTMPQVPSVGSKTHGAYSNYRTINGTTIILVAIASFVCGVLVSVTIVLNVHWISLHQWSHHWAAMENNRWKQMGSISPCDERRNTIPTMISRNDTTPQYEQADVATVLQGQRILVAIASYDFIQIPHLEEVLDGFHDISLAGPEIVDVVIHTTVPYPVPLIDMFNTRFNSPRFTITVLVKPKSLRLHLVDCHRTLFYERLLDYDLFIYTEDDIRITPTTVATYLYETNYIHRLIKLQDPNLSPADFNVGIVRYEYNFPTNVVIDDNTRHATLNVTRVYWEHSGFARPVVPNAVSLVKQQPLAAHGYVSMHNHHQGMYLATRYLLQQWRDRPKCNFATVRNRPGKGSQPTEGTQRVWMSSQMLYGGRHCRVTQIFPQTKFGTLTVLHLPNKNYRRVGKYRNRTFADGSEVFEQPSDKLLTAMEFHIGMVVGLPSPVPQNPYRGIRMVDEVNVTPDRSSLLERRMRAYSEYVERGGVMSESDLSSVLHSDEE
jgi:hypothetical protein